MDRIKNILFKVVDKYWVLLIWAISLFVMYLNYNAIAMKGIIPYYVDLKRIILSGFDPGVATLRAPTFPMWGYAWIFILTENKFLILLSQNIFAVSSLWFSIKVLENNRVFNSAMVRLIKVLLLFSLPLYAFHSVLSPYSIAISLFIFSFMLLYDFLNDSENFGKLILSGILFGLLLNFRSEFLLLPIIFSVILAVIGKLKKAYFVWIIMIFLMLVPWGMYVGSITGKFMMTSTNGGVHFFCGLGNMPGNKWGITYDDGDKKMEELLIDTFGDGYYKNIYLSYKGDQVLKGKFLELVKNDPVEYMKKSLYTLPEIILRGPYMGEFYENNTYSEEDKERYKAVRYKMVFDPLRIEPSEFSFKYVVQIVSTCVGIILYFVSFVVLPFTFIRAFREKRIFFSLVTSAIIYQTLLNMFGGYMRLYTSNMYFFHVLNVVYFVSLISSMCVSKRKARDER